MGGAVGIITRMLAIKMLSIDMVAERNNPIRRVVWIINDSLDRGPTW